jgi:hypothetical protein
MVANANQGEFSSSWKEIINSERHQI